MEEIRRTTLRKLLRFFGLNGFIYLNWLARFLASTAKLWDCAMEISYEFSDLELMHNRVSLQSFLDVPSETGALNKNAYVFVDVV